MSSFVAEKNVTALVPEQCPPSAFHASDQTEKQPSQVQQRTTRWLSPFLLFRVLVLVIFIGFQICNPESLLSSKVTAAISSIQQWRHHPHLLPELYSICSRNGRDIYTSETRNEWVQCVTVRNGTIIDVGDLKSVTSQHYTVSMRASDDLSPDLFYGDDHGVKSRRIWTSEFLKHQVFYLPKGALLTPGLIDSHAHSLQYGWSQQLPLRGSASVEEVIKKVERYVNSHKREITEGRWAEGAGWDQNIWPVKSFPKASDFNKYPSLKDVPIALKRIDIHAEWVSPKVLEMMGDLPLEVPGGQIIRDEHGKPTGVFVDDAMFLIDKVRPQWTEAQMQEYLNLTIEHGLSKGLVGIHDGGVVPEHVEFFQRAGKAGHLPIRFYIMRACPDKEKYCGDDYPMIHGDAENHLNIKSVKLFADGALGSWGAALIQPYSDKPDEYGTMRSPEEVWEPLIKAFVRNGWQVNVHCIGDRANRVVLDAMEKALEELPQEERAGRRLRLEHAQIMQLDDLTRAAKLGIIASYQPTHATSDMWYAESRLGPDRIKGAYAWRRYLEAGGRITLGSDFPVESIDPLKGFYAAVTRLDENGDSPMGEDGWYSDQKLTREEALKGMTIDAAHASFMENQTGSFSVGKQFDAVVWDRNIMRVRQEEILGTKVLSTIVDGKAMWGKLFRNGPHRRQAEDREYSYGSFLKTHFGK